MTQDFSIVQLMLHASWVVQAVVALLLIVSMVSWAAIFRKVFALKRVAAHNEDFDKEFWSGANLNDLYSAAAQSARHGGPMERIFASGMREFHKLRERRITDNGTLLDGARRAMRASFQRELDALETNLSFLGTVGSVAPFVGLLGTVVGIISAFQGIAAEGSGGLGAVSAGIAEALIVTAIGLLVAIPSVLAFNLLSARADTLLLAIDLSRGEFLDYLENQRGGSGEHGSGAKRGEGADVRRAVGVEARASA